MGSMDHLPEARRRVLVLGDYRQTLTVVRSLGRAGFFVILGCEEPRSSSAQSRFVSEVRLFNGASAESYCSQLETYIVREHPDLVFPVGETQLRRLMHASSRLERLTAWASPALETVARCFDKRALYELAVSLGIPTEPWLAFSGEQAWRQCALGMGFPVVVKRNDSASRIFDKKACIYRSAEEFERLLEATRTDSDPSSLLLQKFATGARHNCHFAAADGRIIAYFQQKVLRTDELDLTGIGVEGVSVPPSSELRVHCERLVEALDYTGIGCVQFQVDEAAHRTAFLELNPRIDSTVALPYRLGYDFPLLAARLALYRQARTRRPRVVDKPYPAGKKYHSLYDDVCSWRAAWHGNQLGTAELLTWARRSLWLAMNSHHITWDARDPLPTLHMYWRVVSDSVRMHLSTREAMYWLLVAESVRTIIFPAEGIL